MVKRRSARASTAATTKANDKDKAVKSCNSEETSSKGRVDSPSKKPKLDSSQSSSTKQSNRYVPPFKTSQRIRNRLRLSKSKITEDRSSSQETKVIESVEGETRESNDVSKSTEGKGNSQGKSQKETSAIVLESNEEKEDEMPPHTLVDTRETESDVGMKVKNMEEKYSKIDKEEDIADKNMSETSKKQAGIEIQGVESSTPKEEKAGNQRDREVLQQVLKLSDQTQQSRHHAAKISNFDGLQTLADTCAVVSAVANVVSVVDEPSKTAESSQNKLQNTERKDRGRKDNKNDDDDNNNNLQDLAAEKDSNKNNMISEQQDADVMLSTISKLITFCEEFRTTDNLIDQKIPLSSETDGKKAPKDFMATKLNEPMKKSSSLSSQEIIKDKLSDMLSIVTENERNELPLPQAKSESKTNATLLAGNIDTSLDNPFKTSVTVTDTESDKCKSDGLQNKCMEESLSNSLINSDKNSQNAAETEKNEIEQCEAMSVGNQCYPAIIEKVEDVRNKQISAHANSNKNSQKVTTIETVEITGSKDLTSQEISKRVEDFIGKRIDVLVASDKDVHDQEVPDKVATSPPSCKGKDISAILKNNADACVHDEVPSSTLTSNENLTTDISRNEDKKVETAEEKVEVATSNNAIDEQSYTEEFKALEELLPRDDMGLFDDIMMRKPESINVNDELPSGDSTIEFLTNELNSLHCMVENYERGVEDIKRQYKCNGRF